MKYWIKEQISHALYIISSNADRIAAHAYNAAEKIRPDEYNEDAFGVVYE